MIYDLMFVDSRYFCFRPFIFIAASSTCLRYQASKTRLIEDCQVGTPIHWTLLNRMGSTVFFGGHNCENPMFQLFGGKRLVLPLANNNTLSKYISHRPLYQLFDIELSWNFLHRTYPNINHPQSRGDQSWQNPNWTDPNSYHNTPSFVIPNVLI